MAQDNVYKLHIKKMLIFLQGEDLTEEFKWDARLHQG